MSHHTLLLLRRLCSSSWDSWWWSAAWLWSSRTGSTTQDLQTSTPTDTSGRVLTLIDRQMGGAEPLTLQLRTRRSCSIFSAEQRQTSHSERMSWTLYSMLLGHTDGDPLVLLCFFFCWFSFLLCCSSGTAEFSVVRRTGTRASFSVFRLGVSYSQPKLISRSTLSGASPADACSIRLYLCQKYRCLYVEKHLLFFSKCEKKCNFAHVGCALNAFVTMPFILYYLSHLYLSCRSTNEQILICSCWFQTGTAEWIYCNLFKPGRQR